MHLCIDDPRQGVQPSSVESLLGSSIELADSCEPAASDADIGARDAVRRGGNGAMDDQVKAFAHRGLRGGSQSFSPRHPAGASMQPDWGPIRDGTPPIRYDH
jgi:hypothetical protein